MMLSDKFNWFLHHFVDIACDNSTCSNGCVFSPPLAYRCLSTCQICSTPDVYIDFETNSGVTLHGATFETNSKVRTKYLYNFNILYAEQSWCLSRNSSGSSGRIRGSRETWNLWGRLWWPSFLWLIFTGPGGEMAPSPPPPGSATALKPKFPVKGFSSN